ncbi:MAG: HNH endonuclease signature motif containing protein [Acidimicrobiales bacterium]
MFVSADCRTILEELDGRLDDALDQGFAFADSREAADVIGLVESLRSKVAAIALALHGELERSRVHESDGHASAKVMVRHVGRLPNGEAAARSRGVRMGAVLPRLGEALVRGRLGLDQFEMLGRVYANPRVRHEMIDAQDWFLELAEELGYADFELAVRQWERLADADGAEPANSRTHDSRRVSFDQDHFDLGWELRGCFGAMQGATMCDIYEHFVDAERIADWEKARAEHGDDATDADLPRTEQQRRADALWQIFQDAAGADQSVVPPGSVHLIVWSADTYEEMLRRLDGRAPRRLAPASYRCETIDGVPLEPVEAAAASLVGEVRRAVVDAAGTVIDLGRARSFTGGARTAVQLSSRRCRWPGCSVPTSRCEIDHITEHSRGGCTDPGNGAPLCGRHNRWKQKGFTTWRDPAGGWHVRRPDGTEIE